MGKVFLRDSLTQSAYLVMLGHNEMASMFKLYNTMSRTTEDFRPQEEELPEKFPERFPGSPVGLELFDWWCCTVNEDAGLEITHVELDAGIIEPNVPPDYREMLSRNATSSDPILRRSMMRSCPTDNRTRKIADRVCVLFQPKTQAIRELARQLGMSQPEVGYAVKQR